MDWRRILALKWHEVGPLLQIRFWKPLRDMIEMFHLLPLAAAALCFVLFAVNGQFREIYIAYLEGPVGGLGAWLGGLAAAAAALVLLSALLYEAHFLLSTLRIGVVYSGYSNPNADSSPRRLQYTTAFVLALVPWLGIAIGLVNARNFVAERYCQLISPMPPDRLESAQHLLRPNGWIIAAALIALGAAIAVFSRVDQKAWLAQRAVALLSPALAMLLFLLLSDWLVLDISYWFSKLMFAITLVVTVGYSIIFQLLYKRRHGLVLARSRDEVSGNSDVQPPISIPRTRGELFRSWVVDPLKAILNRRHLSTGVSFWAFLLWFLLASWFAIAQLVVLFVQKTDVWRPKCPSAGTHLPLPGHWAVFPVAICLVIALGLFTVLFLNSTSEQWKWRGVVIKRRFVLIGLVALLAAIAKAISLCDIDTLVSAYRLIGPLATTTLQAIFLITIFALLAWLSQQSGFPVLSLAILAVVTCVMFPNHVGAVALLLALISAGSAVAAFLARFIAVGTVALLLILLGATEWHELGGEPVRQIFLDQKTTQIDRKSMKIQYECWLRQRGIWVKETAEANEQLDRQCPGPNPPPKNTGTQKPYVVYIFAAEGGGIYAASAAAMFFARLQDASAQFARHVFAISGVSGGAIGSTVFQALSRAELPENGSATANAAPAAPCLPHVAAREDNTVKGILQEKVACIMEDDHFSPIVGSIFSELTGSSAGRADALVASFDNSVSTYDQAAGENLLDFFSQAWSFKSTVPALVLNATWVETGFRVAFAPFHLHNIDESLYSFTDDGMPDEGRERLMDAAAVSARFPLILPPFFAAMPIGNSGSGNLKRWNFVDGGYSDNSGAATAVDLYAVLKSVSAPNVEVRVILLTSAELQPDLRGATINGTAFRDTMGPIDALINVRQNLGDQAVARACSQFYRDDDNFERPIQSNSSPGIVGAETNERCNQHAGLPDAALQLIEIQDRTYGLSLGWKISQTSFDIISWMLGDPNECPSNSSRQTPARAPEPNRATNPDTPNVRMGLAAAGRGSGNAGPSDIIVDRNSCVLRSIVTAVQG